VSTPPPADNSLPLSLEQLLDPICRRFEAAWQAGEQPRIEDYLAEAPPEAREALLRELLALELAYRRQGGVGPSPEEYEGRFPGQTALVREVFATSRDALPTCVADLGGPGPPASPAGGTRYLPLRPHARGGLGEVLVAEDAELRREVALKRIRAAYAHDPASRRRFLMEAEVTGRLEHPGIVPVYGLVWDGAGQPCYAMRLIQGETLQQAIRRFHEAERPGRDPAERRLALRALLTRFVAVCQTMAYAHDRGVLHRDLKPANVMLGPFGETLVVDWGLAKAFDPGGGQSSGTTSPAAAAVPADADAVTRTGAALGTPAYMSPEQAAGGMLGPASDVYGLGAMLYEVLTNRAPIEGTRVGEVLERARRGQFPPPRQVRRGTPAALEAVCLKAMALRPEQRYATAAALAGDVDRWLADEPVTAWREPLAARLRRWGRRHRTLVAAAAVLLVTAVVALAASTVVVGSALRREEQARRERALAQVEVLLQASPQAVPGIIDGLEPHRGEVLRRLREVWAQDGRPQRRLRAGLALLPVDPAAVKDRLAAGMLETEDPREVLLLRDALRPHGAELAPALWREADAASAPPGRRFRALVALAAFDGDGGRWRESGGPAAEGLLAANPLHLGPWVEALAPVRAALVAPLGEAFRCHAHPDKRQVAAIILADYAADRPEVLADLLLDADDRQYPLLLPRLLAHPEQAAVLMAEELDRPAAADAPDDRKDAVAKRQAHAAVTLLHLDRPERVWPLLGESSDPRPRGFLVHRLGPLGVDPHLVTDRLGQERDAGARRALLLSLGGYDPGRLAGAERQALAAGLLRDYRDDPDPGTHSALDWLLRRWGHAEELRRIDREAASPDQRARGGRRWYVNGQGDTLVVFPGPVEYVMGSPPADVDRLEHESQRAWRIPRSFAVATREVTVRQFGVFLKANPDFHLDYPRWYSPDEDRPIIALTWFEAARYCNWLSRAEGIPEDQLCYAKQAEDPEAMTPVRGYLSKRGYRLPTEAEWEYACAAGAATSRFYGSAVELLGHYAWYNQTAGDRTRAVGLLQPNESGLFDIYGNVMEWTNDRLERPAEGKEITDDTEDPKIVQDADARVLRGGGFGNHQSTVRTARRIGCRPRERYPNVGFRVARTYP
jgi:formylglycine-generating enzyme required for sulfatase activity